jgi:hypothetical protein
MDHYFSIYNALYAILSPRLSAMQKSKENNVAFIDGQNLHL